MSCPTGIWQTWNPINHSWVKFKFTSEGVKFFDVKQKNPNIPFKNVPVKSRPKNINVIDMLLAGNKKIKK
jgi:hypothetical protein